MGLGTLDIAIVLAYLAGIFILAQWVSREKAGHQKDAKDYFLAGKSLPWWAIGASLIAANISAEQIIQRHQSGIDARDMAWMFRRLLGALGEAHAAGFVHGAVLPHHVLVHPVSHDFILVDWTSASKIGGPQRTPYMVSRYKDFYPDSTAAKEPPTASGDIHMAARTMQALLGKGVTTPGQIAYWDRGCPPQIRSFLAGCITPSSFTAWEMLDLFTELIERLWGKRQYHEFPWP